jgi:bacterioferritin (cytochrome b1)
VKAKRSLTRLTTDEILAGLNQALLAERQAVADYHVRAQASAQPQVQAALETLRDVERDHAIRVAARIRALGGTPEEQGVEAQAVGEPLAAGLTHDLIGEQWAIVEYARLVAGILGDEETVDLLTELLEDEIRHAQWLKTTLRTLQADDQAR